VYLAGRFKPGDFLLVNLAPLARGYRLLLAPARMLEVPGPDRMERSVRGWFQPPLPLPEFLAAYSRLGGTHHLALSYGACLETVSAFGRMMGGKHGIEVLREPYRSNGAALAVAAFAQAAGAGEPQSNNHSRSSSRRRTTQPPHGKPP
jgi:hypothetical protein